jgi:cephalosporin hydroxylase
MQCSVWLLLAAASAAPPKVLLRITQPSQGDIVVGNNIPCAAGIEFGAAYGGEIHHGDGEADVLGPYEYICFVVNGTKWRCKEVHLIVASPDFSIVIPPGTHELTAELIPFLGMDPALQIDGIVRSSSVTFATQLPACDAIKGGVSQCLATPETNSQGQRWEMTHFSPQVDFIMVHPRRGSRVTGNIVQFKFEVRGWVIPHDGQICIDHESTEDGEHLCFGSSTFEMKLLPGEHEISAYLHGTSHTLLAITSTRFTILTKEETKAEVWDPYHYWAWATNVWRKTTFLGVPIRKYPNDLWNYQEILFDLKPSLVVEFGAAYGGSAYYLSMMLHLVHGSQPGIPGTANQKFRLLTVDVDTSQLHPSYSAGDHAPHVEVIEASSTSAGVRERIVELKLLFPGPMFCILDSHHHQTHVERELELLVPLLESGDYLVVEDTNVNMHPVDANHGPGPYEAVVQYLRRNPRQLKRDVAREEKFGFTAAPLGYFTKI